jgi:hypothetical protein
MRSTLFPKIWPVGLIQKDADSEFFTLQIDESCWQLLSMCERYVIDVAACSSWFPSDDERGFCYWLSDLEIIASLLDDADTRPNVTAFTAWTLFGAENSFPPNVLITSPFQGPHGIPRFLKNCTDCGELMDDADSDVCKDCRTINALFAEEGGECVG